MANGKRERCNDCAFTVGTDASMSPSTAVVATLCAMTGDRFDCHIERGPCVGWAEAVAERKAKGALIPDGPEYQHARLLTGFINEWARLEANTAGAK